MTDGTRKTRQNVENDVGIRGIFAFACPKFFHGGNSPVNKIARIHNIHIPEKKGGSKGGSKDV